MRTGWQVRGVKSAVCKGGGCWQKTWIAVHASRLQQCRRPVKGRGSELSRDLGVCDGFQGTCWEVSKQELPPLLQNKFLDRDPACLPVLPFYLAVYLVVLLLGTWLPTSCSCCCSESFWKTGISCVLEKSLPAFLSLDKSTACHGSASPVRGRAREQPLKKRENVKKEVIEGEGKLASFPTLNPYGRD